MTYPLSSKALKDMEESYREFGGVPAQLDRMVKGTVDAIRDYVDRPEGEKDALMAAVVLYFNTDMTIYKELPANVAAYGLQVQKILEDALANPRNTFGASNDWKQIGLALSIPSKDEAMKAVANVKEKVTLMALEDPRLLKSFITQMQQAIKKGQEGNLYFTGEQPRLEAEAKKVLESVKEATEDLVTHMVTLLGEASPPPSKPKPPAPSSP